MSTGEVVQVFVQTKLGDTVQVGWNVDKEKLLYLSRCAQHNMTEPNVLVMSEETTDIETAKQACAWVNSYDPSVPARDQQFVMQHVNEGQSFALDFDYLVCCFATSCAFVTSHKYRDGHLRQSLWEYIHWNPLTAHEFVTLHKNLPWEQGLLTAAQNRTMHLAVNGPAPPELTQIIEYAAANGLGGKMAIAEQKCYEAKLRKDMQDESYY